MKIKFLPESIIRSAWNKLAAHEKKIVERAYCRIQCGDEKKCKAIAGEVVAIAKKHGVKVPASAEWKHYAKFRRRDLDNQMKSELREHLFYGATTSAENAP